MRELASEFDYSHLASTEHEDGEVLNDSGGVDALWPVQVLEDGQGPQMHLLCVAPNTGRSDRH